MKEGFLVQVPELSSHTSYAGHISKNIHKQQVLKIRGFVLQEHRHPELRAIHLRSSSKNFPVTSKGT